MLTTATAEVIIVIESGVYDAIVHGNEWMDDDDDDDDDAEVVIVCTVP